MNKLEFSSWIYYNSWYNLRISIDTIKIFWFDHFQLEIFLSVYTFNPIDSFACVTLI